MNLRFVKHEKLSLKNHSIFNERWLQERIEEEPGIIGLGNDLRLVDRERSLKGGGRLDLLLADDGNSRRYEVELQLGKTDASHIIRCIEYWDLESKKYPSYEHVAVIIAEDVTTRFLNVISLMAGSIPIIAIQLDALQFGENVLLNFVQVLDQTDLRGDDEDDGGGGGLTDRDYWLQKAGQDLLNLCDKFVAWINDSSETNWEMNFLRGYIGISSKGSVNNFVHFIPRPSKNYTHVIFRNTEAKDWVDKFDAVGIPAQNNRKNRLRLSINSQDFDDQKELLRELTEDTREQYET